MTILQIVERSVVLGVPMALVLGVGVALAVVLGVALAVVLGVPLALVLYFAFLRRWIRDERAADATRRLVGPGPTWRTKNGRVLLISEMHEAHLLNAIAYMQRRLPLMHVRTRHQRYNNLLNEALRRGLPI